MILIGLAGYAGSGKDTVADYLVRRYGFLKFSFSDALYREVAQKFGLETEDELRDRAKKDTPQDFLALEFCLDDDFVRCVQRLPGDGVDITAARSPREILQWWGTEYRRAQDPDYWIKRADQWIVDVWQACMYPEHRPQLFVNTSVRFANERAWIHRFTNGNVWHIRRAGYAPINAHVSETPLEVLHDAPLIVNGEVARERCFERELHNNDTVARLHDGIELLLSRQCRFVKVEPMLPDVDPESTGDPVEMQTFGPLKS